MDDIFGKLYKLAKNDKAVLDALFETYNADDPLDEFCKYVKTLGFDITIGDIITMGEEYTCNQMKSTNGGGVNLYDYFDDPWEMFFASLEHLK